MLLRCRCVWGVGGCVVESRVTDTQGQGAVWPVANEHGPTAAAAGKLEESGPHSRSELPLLLHVFGRYIFVSHTHESRVTTHDPSHSLDRRSIDRVTVTRVTEVQNSVISLGDLNRFHATIYKKHTRWRVRKGGASR